MLEASSSLRWEWEFKEVEPSGRSLGYWGGYSQKGKSLSFYSEIQCFLYNAATAAHAEGKQPRWVLPRRCALFSSGICK